MKNQLDYLRKQIDKIDNSIINSLARRIQIVKKIGQYKKSKNIPPFDKFRWQQVLTTIMKKSKSLGLDQKMIKKIYHLIHKQSLKIETKL